MPTRVLECMDVANTNRRRPSPSFILIFKSWVTNFSFAIERLHFSSRSLNLKLNLVISAEKISMIKMNAINSNIDLHGQNNKTALKYCAYKINPQYFLNSSQVIDNYVQLKHR